jgi:chromosome segregation protein
MRLRRLALRPYGHLAACELDFGEAPLAVVLGGNEAGKTTALEAIADALFGVPHRSPRGAVHGNTSLRIGVTLEDAAGRLAFVRRKGLRDTLLDETGAALPEAALARFLGGLTREAFEEGHALDAARLRAGGKRLLDAASDPDESVLVALGLADAAKACKRLGAMADREAGSNAAHVRLKQATDAHTAAARRVAEASVSALAWSEATARELRGRAAVDAASARQAELRAEGRRCERIRRAAPELRKLDAARTALAPLAGRPLLTDADEAEWAREMEAARAAREALGRANDALEQLATEAAALKPDPDALALAERISALHEERGEVASAMRDLPGVEAELPEFARRVGAAARALGLAERPELLRERVPDAARREAARRALGERRRLLAEERRAADNAADAEDAARLAAEVVAAEPAPPPSGPLRAAVKSVLAEGRLDAELAAAEAAFGAAAAEAGAALAALPLWSGDPDALARLVLPLPALAQAAEERLVACGKALDEARLAAAAAEREAAEASLLLGALSAEGEVPTPDAVAAARGRRDAAFSAWPAGFDAASASAFVALVAEADRLADRAAAEADRVARHRAEAERRALAEARLPALRAAETDAARRLAEASADWAGLWPLATLGPPQAMREWLAARSEVLRLAREAAARRAVRDGLVERHDAALRRLAEACGASAGSLAGRLAEAEAQAVAAEAREAEHARRAQEAERCTGEADRLRVAARRAAERRAAQDAAWDAAIAPLGCATGAVPETVEEALAQWSAIAEAATPWQAAESRVAAMRGLLERFAKETAALRAALDEPAEAGAAVFAERLAKARATALRLEAIAVASSNQAREAQALRKRLEQAEAALGALAGRAGAEAPEALPACFAAMRERQRLMKQITDAEEALRRDGEEAQLRAEFAAMDEAAAEEALHGLEPAQRAADESARQAAAELKDAEAALAALDRGREAELHAQDAANAAAAAREAAERYAVLHIARSLLGAALDRLRAERSAPLLAAASSRFARLTCGRYARITIEEEEGGVRWLRALRAEGGAVPVEALSEGTRDQLFLALRLAALEAAASPLPLVADDLFASFDDARAAAGLVELAALGGRQVILFTHHRHIAELAGNVAGAQVIEIV